MNTEATVLPKIKQALQPALKFLQENKDRTVAEIMPGFLELAVSRPGGGRATTHHKNEAGEVDAILCYYYKKWMHPEKGGFSKVKTGFGYNTSCACGAAKGSKQNRDYVEGGKQMLVDLTSRTLSVDDMPTRQAELEAAKVAIIPREDGYGFDTLEACLEHNRVNGL